MAPQGWATAEERLFLTSYIPEYESCQVKRRYKAFWQRLNAEFLNKFPVIDKLFPGQKVTDLTLEQKEMHTAAVIKQQQRLKEWYRWQMNPRSRNAGTVITKKDLRTIYSGRSRGRKPYEVFAKLYADDVEKEKVARCEAAGVTGRKTLNVWQDVSRELFLFASDEQKVAVQKAMENEEKEDMDDAHTPTQYLRYLKKLPTLLDATITPAVKKAGVLAFVTIVGPDPEQNGKISCKTLQFGDKPETPVFAQEWDGHDSVFAEALARFASRHEFTPEACSARSLRQGANSQASSDTDDEGDSTASSASLSTPEPSDGRTSSPIQIQSAEVQAGIQPNTVTEQTAQPSPVQRPVTPTVTTPSLFLVDRPSPPVRAPDLDYVQTGLLPLSHLCLSAVNFKPPTLAPSHQLQPSLSAHDGLSIQGGPWRETAQNISVNPDDDGSDNEQDDDASEDLWNFTPAHQNALDMTLLSIESQSPSAPSRPPAYPHDPHMFFPPATSTTSPTPSAMLFQNELTSARTVRRSSDDMTSSPNAVSTSCAPASAFRAFVTPRSVIPGESASAEPPLPPLPLPPPAPLTSLPGSGLPLRIQSPLPSPPRAQSSGTGLSGVVNALPSRLLPASHSPHHDFLANNQLSEWLPPSTLSDIPTTSFPGPSSGNELQPMPSDDSSCQVSLPRLDLPHPSLASSPSPAMPPITDYRRPGPSADLPSPSLTSSRATEGTGNCGATSSLVPTMPAVSPHSGNGESPGTPAPQSGHVLIPVPSHAHLNSASQNAGPDQTSLFTQGTLTANTAQIASAVGLEPLPSNPDIEPLPANQAVESLPSIPRQPTDSSPLSAPTLDSSCRRSARGIMPSRRNQQLQLIGTNVASAGGPDEIEGAAWFSSALEHLRSFDLGEKWTKLVDNWANLEALMGYGKTGRGTLPTAGRPEEWQRWTSKTWHGTRRYDKMPQIDSAADLAIAFRKWWLTLQPSFRVSDGPYPLPVFVPPKSATSADSADAWATLRKSGQNGFVSIILLLGWWGHVAETATSQWEDDSRPAWSHLVSDVRSVIDTMTVTLQERTATKRPRSSAKENIVPASRPTKRAKRT